MDTPEVGQMPYCPKCGAEAKIEDTFCNECGTSISSEVTSEDIKPKFETESKIKKPTKLWYLVPFFFNIVGGIVAYFAIRKKDNAMAKKMLFVGGIMVILVLAMGGEETEKTKTTTEATVVKQPLKLEILDISYFDFDSIFGSTSSLTDIQKEEEWKKYEGKIVKWEGSVVDVDKMLGSYQVTFKHKPYTFTYDVLVTYDKSMKDKLMTIQKGDYVTYTGKLKSKGGALTTPVLEGIDIEG
jgi:hypothetical protein